ncbi:Uncharacterised protein [Mycobacteroides abscessus subsp. massiliense]|nr:Uncharacterised protein [Mycobacteroides abscessus subsp. massiliense]
MSQCVDHLAVAVGIVLAESVLVDEYDQQKIVITGFVERLGHLLGRDT